MDARVGTNEVSEKILVLYDNGPSRRVLIRSSVLIIRRQEPEKTIDRIDRHYREDRSTRHEAFYEQGYEINDKRIAIGTHTRIH